MAKRKSKPGGLVYSTDPDFNMDDREPEQETLSPAQQYLKVRLETKHRAGKIVTLVEGFIGTPDDLKELGKNLKVKCGTGGSAKDHEIIIQGDYREQVRDYLKEWGYKVKGKK